MTTQIKQNKMEKTNANVKTAMVTQSGNEELGMKEKNLYFLVIETSTGKLQINVGQKTHDEVKRLTVPRETTTNIKILEDQEKAKAMGLIK